MTTLNDRHYTSVRHRWTSYVAASYVWGNGLPTSIIEVNGMSFNIRENLWHFLRVVRNRYKSVLFWIDAICIDQDDVLEKSSQIRLMDRIYLNATVVYSWLGNERSTVIAPARFKAESSRNTFV